MIGGAADAAVEAAPAEDAAEEAPEMCIRDRMRPLGIKTENVVVDFAEGDMIVVIGGVWKDTVGVITCLLYTSRCV